MSRSPGRTSPRQLLHEHARDHAAPLTVLAIGMACCGWFVARAGLELRDHGLTMIGGLCLVAALVLGCILDKPGAAADAGGSPVAVAKASEIGRMTDEEFDRLLDEVERQARMPFPCPFPVAGAVVGDDDDEFARLVRDALDELPEFVQDELRRGNLAVMISDYGCEWQAYGLYSGGTAADDDFNHRITIFRDTLTDSFGHDPEQLRRQVTITVRHEVAHHFGADEGRVRELGL